MLIPLNTRKTLTTECILDDTSVLNAEKITEEIAQDLGRRMIQDVVGVAHTEREGLTVTWYTTTQVEIIQNRWAMTTTVKVTATFVPPQLEHRNQWVAEFKGGPLDGECHTMRAQDYGSPARLEFSTRTPDEQTAFLVPIRTDTYQATHYSTESKSFVYTHQEGD